MNIEIRDINFMPEVSDIALAFTAEVWIDGEMVGMAFNEGIGCNLFSMNDNQYAGTELETFIQDMLGANRGLMFEKLNAPEPNQSGFWNCECKQ